uniref:hypothetical protein n=1 Tax=Iodobacter fluviatilis TaxID=537 RepID=UPI000E1B7D42|nr:hypothetical protein [Iodobacter fluviatilis]
MCKNKAIAAAKSKTTEAILIERSISERTEGLIRRQSAQTSKANKQIFSNFSVTRRNQYKKRGKTYYLTIKLKFYFNLIALALAYAR